MLSSGIPFDRPGGGSAFHPLPAPVKVHPNIQVLAIADRPLYAKMRCRCCENWIETADVSGKVARALFLNFHRQHSECMPTKPLTPGEARWLKKALRAADLL